jgi:transposase-like protein
MSLKEKGLTGLVDQTGEANPRWRHEITEEVIRRCISEGMSVNGMVEELGVSAELIRNRLARYGLEAGPGRKGGQKRKELGREALEELLGSGMTRQAMAGELGVSLPTLRRELKRHGLG